MARVAAARREAGILMDRHTGEETAAPRSLADMVQQAWSLKTEMERLERQFRDLQERILAVMDAGETLVVPGVCRVARSIRQRVDISDPETLMGVLGPRWEDLVETSVRYRPTGKLVAMGTDGDHPLSRDIAACLTVTETPVLTFRAES